MVKFLIVFQEFLNEVFNCLFALPSPKERSLPKCKSQASRSVAYDLLVELVRGNVENYTLLHEKVMSQHHRGKNDLLVAVRISVL